MEDGEASWVCGCEELRSAGAVEWEPASKGKTMGDLRDVSKTMLLTLYARANYSKGEKALFHDAKAEEVVDRLDYDFAAASKDFAMSSGTIARTLVFDELVGGFIVEHPEAIVVNIGSGLDTRFYRIDNGAIGWYNVDLPDAMEVRNEILPPVQREHNIAASAMDPSWANRVGGGDMLFVIEGLTMYLEAGDIAQMLSIIRDSFDNALVMMETTSAFWVSKQGVEKSVQETGSKFTWGCDSFEDLGELAKGFVKVADDDILRGMEQLYPAYRLIDWIPFVKKAAEKILVFRKDENATIGSK